MSATIHINPVLNITPEVLEEFCLKNKIRKLSLFGSALRGEMQADSDVDILVEFESGEEPGLIGFAGMEIELSEIIGQKVDLRTPGDLSRYFREEVVHSAEAQYEKK